MTEKFNKKKFSKIFSNLLGKEIELVGYNDEGEPLYQRKGDNLKNGSVKIISNVYKCPKCSCYDELEKCDNCGYKGDPKEFEAKRYSVNYKVSASVIAFDKDDAKKEAKELTEVYGFDHLDYEIMEIKERKDLERNNGN